MLLKCPACGGICSLDAWVNQAQVSEVLKIVAGFPAEVGGDVLRYVALFRSVGNEQNRGLSWKKALKLLTELKGYIQSGYVQRGSKAARPCPVEVWCEALKVVINSTSIKLPLKGHGYLLEVAYVNADNADKKREVELIKVEHTSGKGLHAEDIRKKYTPSKLEFAIMKKLISGVGGGGKSSNPEDVRKGAVMFIDGLIKDGFKEAEVMDKLPDKYKEAIKGFSVEEIRIEMVKKSAIEFMDSLRKEGFSEGEIIKKLPDKYKRALSLKED